MLLSILKIAVAACLIAGVSFLSGKRTVLAGFLTALPVTSLLALAFSHLQYANQEQSIDYAKSIFLAVPVTLMFFVPFLFATKLGLSFWMCYGLGVFLLAVGYFIHQALF